jgi:hypothetical protein
MSPQNLRSGPSLVRRRRPREAPYVSLARMGNLDPSTLEQLIAAEERQRASDAALAFAADFTQMSAELPVIDEHGVLRHGDQIVGTYALWEDVNEAIRPVLRQFGFALSFVTTSQAEDVVITAEIIHKSGHSRSTSLRLAPDASGDKNSIQAIGSAVSYGRRYTASALLNLTSRGEDDDGRRAAGCIGTDQQEEIDAALMKTGADANRLLKYLRVETLALLPASRFEEALAAIEARAGQTRRRG